MAGNIFGSLSLAAPTTRDPRPDRAEPRLFPASRARPIDSPAADTEALPLIGIDGRVSASSPTISAPDRLTPARAEPSAGTLVSLALVGLVATAIIGAFFSIGLLLLAGPAKQIVAASEPISAHPSAPIPASPGTPHPVATSSAPVPAVVPRPAVTAVKPPPPIKTVQTVTPPHPEQLTVTAGCPAAQAGVDRRSPPRRRA